jgi:uncharacterized membrane protein
MSAYVILKWIHVLLAIAALGANITYGFWLARAGRDPAHLAFTLKGIKFLDDRVANPAYGLLLLTGMATAGVGRIPFTTPWLQLSIVLYVILVVLAVRGYTPTLRRQIDALQTGGANSPEFQRLAGRATGLGITLVVIAVLIVFVMVTKPTLWG